jgi:hypothetical protein
MTIALARSVTIFPFVRLIARINRCTIVNRKKEIFEICKKKSEVNFIEIENL